MPSLIKRSDFYLIPNVLTISRLIAIPIVASFAYWGWNRTAALVFAAAGISDYVDGWIARRYNYESRLGMLLDPLADKIIVLSTMVMLLFLGRLDWQLDGWDLRWIGPLLVIVTVGRETAITGIRSIASSIGMTIPADRWGKLKTWIQFFAIAFLLWAEEPFTYLGKILLIFSVITALISGLRYATQFVKLLPEE